MREQAPAQRRARCSQTANSGSEATIEVAHGSAPRKPYSPPIPKLRVASSKSRLQICLRWSLATIPTRLLPVSAAYCMSAQHPLRTAQKTSQLTKCVPLAWQSPRGRCRGLNQGGRAGPGRPASVAAIIFVASFLDGVERPDPPLGVWAAACCSPQLEGSARAAVAADGGARARVEPRWSPASSARRAAPPLRQRWPLRAPSARQPLARGAARVLARPGAERAATAAPAPRRREPPRARARRFCVERPRMRRACDLGGRYVGCRAAWPCMFSLCSTAYRDLASRW